MTRVNAASMMTGRHPGGHGLLGNTLVIRDWDPHRAIPALAPELRAVAAATGHTRWRRRSARCWPRTDSHSGPWWAAPAATHGSSTRGRPGWRRGAPSGIHCCPSVTTPRCWRAAGPGLRKARPRSGAFTASPTSCSSYLLPEVDPDVALVWFLEPDTSQHAAGVGSPPAVEALTAADAQLGRALEALSRRGVDPDVLVVSDHGYRRSPAGSSSEDVVRAAGFPPGEAPGGVTVAANGGAALFYVRDSDPRVLERLTRWLVAQPWTGALVAGHAEGAALGLLPGDLLGAGGASGPPTSSSPSGGIPRGRPMASPASRTAPKGRLVSARTAPAVPTSFAASWWPAARASIRASCPRCRPATSTSRQPCCGFSGDDRRRVRRPPTRRGLCGGG